MVEALIDTDILSEVIKRKDSRVLTKARRYLAEHQRFAFSSITAYEIIRGMRASQATRQLSEFLKTVATSDVLPANMPVLMRAAELWADAHRSGHPQSDADLIIARDGLGTRSRPRDREYGSLCLDSWPDFRQLARAVDPVLVQFAARQSPAAYHVPTPSGTPAVSPARSNGVPAPAFVGLAHPRRRRVHQSARARATSVR
jgi:tRNA(fMet)-specific endonuclease VapC